MKQTLNILNINSALETCNLAILFFVETAVSPLWIITTILAWLAVDHLLLDYFEILAYVTLSGRQIVSVWFIGRRKLIDTFSITKI